MNLTEHSYPFPVSPEHTLCFTGHRPEKLPEGKMLSALLKALYYYIDSAVAMGYTCFLDGMADGIDYLAAEYLFRKRSEFPEIQVFGIQPFHNYAAFFRYRHYDLQHLNAMQQGFDGIICLEGEFDRYGGRKNDFLFVRRNHFLIDHSSAVIAVCSLERSGSKHTVDYARQKKLIIWRLEANPNLFYLPEPAMWPVEKINF